MTETEILNKIMEIYKERLEENPEQGEVFLQEAHENAYFLEEIGLFQLAIRIYQQILALNPEDFEAKEGVERLSTVLH